MKFSFLFWGAGPVLIIVPKRLSIPTKLRALDIINGPWDNYRQKLLD